MDFKYAQSWLLGIVCFVYGIYRVIGGSDESFNWVDAAAIFGFCYSIYYTQLKKLGEDYKKRKQLPQLPDISWFENNYEEARK